MAKRKKPTPTSPEKQPPLQIRDRVKELKRIKASDLADNEKNWRVHPQHQRDALRGLLDEIGFAGAELCYYSQRNAGRLTLIDGHLRKSEVGDAEIPCLITDLTDEEADLLLLTYDPIAALAEADKGILDGLLAQTHSESQAVQDLLKSLAEGELVSIHDPGEFAGLTDPDEVPAPPDEPVTKPGDLWLLGNHRLLCGDSSKPEDVDRLLAGAKIHLVNTDPPYNVKVEPRSNNAIAAGLSSFQGNTHHQKLDVVRHPEKAKPTNRKMRAKDRPLANDFVSSDEFDRLLAAWFGNLARVIQPGRCFYIWGGYANVGNYPPVLKAMGMYFSQAIIWNKLHPVLTRKDFMGAHEWCQPPDTIVQTPDGPCRLGSLRSGDRVLSFYQHSSAVVGLRHGFEAQVAHRHYDGKLYGITVSPQQSWSTSGHIWTVRMTDDYPRYWCVYLMRRGNWWRIGVTKMRTTWGFGLKGRLIHEHGNEGWILTLHGSHAEARMREQLISLRYGIPMTCWVDDPNPNRRQAHHIEAFYAQLDQNVLMQGVEAALEAHHRDIEYPFVRMDDTRPKYGSRQSIQVRACNLLPEVMEVPVATGGIHVRWQPIRAIDVQRYSGPVRSLGVDKHHHYLADGLATHNCFYGWKEGAGHKFFGPNNVTDLWEVKKINPQNMVHLTEKPVELATRAMAYSSKPGENVLDLFGGSGSTLIGAEMTGRRAFLMELDTAYSDVIVQRWEQFTGKQATKEQR